MSLKSQVGTVSNYKEIAIIGPTASGKSALAIDVAKKFNAVIFSIDSLAVYKEMDIVSAKPSIEEQSGIRHFGIDALDVTEHFSAHIVAKLYQEAKAYAQQEHKNLVIVGGSSFYLKSLLTGLSVLPEFSDDTRKKTQELLEQPSKAHALLFDVDPNAVNTIEPNDRYRLEKLLLIYLETGLKPSVYFKDNPPQAIIKEIPIFEILVDRDVLRERVNIRTKIMIDSGLIDEIAYLESKYSRAFAPMKAIGVIETLQYLDNVFDKDKLQELIVTHTMQLAKRQSTFNRTQFGDVIRLALEDLTSNVFSFMQT